jgi:two-component system chemotaxis response regulator CheB
MSNAQISVLVVDDSALMRNLVGRIVESAEDLTLAGKAMNGKFALSKIPTLNPDVIILDLEMPEMNGVQFLQEYQSQLLEMPVIVLSAVAKKGAKITMDALAHGAVDFIMKPQGSAPDEVRTIAEQLIDLIRLYGNKYRLRKGLPPAIPKEQHAEVETSEDRRVARPVAPPRTEAPASAVRAPAEPPRAITPKGAPGPLEIIAIGISTGGPNALRQMFAEIDPDLPVPVLVVQHMPAGFTMEFARSLDRICPLEVKEAADGDIIKPGRVLIAPGDHHIVVEKRKLANILRLNQDPPMNGHRPSADVLFKSVAENFGNRAMGVIMTGMGKDGARHIGDIYEAGGVTLGQDHDSAVVYGMPRVAFEYGYITEQVSLERMATEISNLAQKLTG